MLIIGVGNAMRRDDGVGPYVARRLEPLMPESGHVIEQSGEGSNLMEAWAGEDVVILIDAVRSSAEPGTVTRFDAVADTVPGGFFHYSTHAFSVAEAIELSRVMELLPEVLVVYGIEGEDFESGQGLSPVVADAAEMVVGQIVTELRSLGVPIPEEARVNDE
jgi:hydrogenase maturation protease